MSEYSEFVASRFKQLDTPAASLHHATTGIIGEVVELLCAEGREHIGEECGDLEFYLQWLTDALIVKGFEITNDSWGTDALLTGPLNLLGAAACLLDLTKKAWVYNKPLEEIEADLAGGVWNLRRNLNDFYLNMGLDCDQIRSDNMAKLRKRYPDGYSDAAAQARADKVEGA